MGAASNKAIERAPKRAKAGVKQMANNRQEKSLCDMGAKHTVKTASGLKKVSAACCACAWLSAGCMWVLLLFKIVCTRNSCVVWCGVLLFVVSRHVTLCFEQIIRPRFAVGGLDQDLMDGDGGVGGKSMSKKMEKVMLRKDGGGKEFSEFDPSKRLRKGGKIGNTSFKSKSKFKRKH